MGIDLEFFVIFFEKDKMILWVLIYKVIVIGMWGFSFFDVISQVMKMLKGKVKVKCVMWLCWV